MALLLFKLARWLFLTNSLAILGLIEIHFLYFSLVLLTVLFCLYSVNKPPAKILGDVGSIPIGFLLGFIIIYNIIKANLIIPFLIIMMYYLLDSIITIFIRFYKKREYFSKHTVAIFIKKLSGKATITSMFCKELFT